MSPDDIRQAIIIARSRMIKHGIPVPLARDLVAYVALIIYIHGEQNKKTLSNKIVHICSQDFCTLNAKYSEKIHGTNMRRTVHLKGYYYDDYFLADEAGELVDGVGIES
jgi:hypothetical protein